MPEIFGIVLIAGGLWFAGRTIVIWGLSHPDSGFGKWLYEYWPFPVPEWIQKRIAERHAQSQERLEAVLDAAPTGTSRVREAKSKTVITIDGQPNVTNGAGKLLELKFYDGNAAHKVHVDPDGQPLREFKIIMTTDQGLLTEQPEGEGLSQKFFLYQNQTRLLPRAFQAYCKGTPGNPGPVARFAASEQGSDEYLDVADGRWQLQDIVWADLKVESGIVFVAPGGPMPRFVMILARNIKDQDQWILYVEPRSGGVDPSLWIGGQFDPEVEVRPYG